MRRPGSLPRSLPDTRLPPLPLEERSRPGPLAVRVEDPWSIQGPVEGRPDCGRPRCVPLLEVAPYVRLLGYGRGRGLLSGESHPLLQTDAGVVDSNPRIDLSGFRRYPEPERHLFEQRETVMPVAEVQGFVQHHLSPTNSSGISQAPSDVEAEVDSDSVVSDAFGGGGVTIRFEPFVPCSGRLIADIRRPVCGAHCSTPTPPAIGKCVSRPGQLHCRRGRAGHGL